MKTVELREKRKKRREELEVVHLMHAFLFNLELFSQPLYKDLCFCM